MAESCATYEAMKHCILHSGFAPGMCEVVETFVTTLHVLDDAPAGLLRQTSPEGPGGGHVRFMHAGSCIFGASRHIGASYG